MRRFDDDEADVVIRGRSQAAHANARRDRLPQRA
jgi:hypothetical protein